MSGSNGNGTHPGGAPRKILLRPEMIKTISEAVELGAHLSLACKAGCIAYSTFREYLIQGEEDVASDIRPEDSIYRQLYEAVQAAQYRCMLRQLAIIEKAAQRGEWTAAAWKLERNWPELYALRGRIELTGPGGGPVQHAHLHAGIDLKTLLADPADAEAYMRLEKKLHEGQNGSKDGGATAPGGQPA